MAIQKKHGKGRLDKWYKLAKEKGYRARAAFKLIQLNKKYSFLEKSKVVLDLCAAPGSWCQVAAEVMPAQGILVGVDLVPIKPIPRAITFQGDITSDKCRATIRQHLKTWKADTVLHDGAPNVGVAWVQDAYTQAELALQALKLATGFLVGGGTFVTKVFRSKDYNALLWVFKQLFSLVEATKPPSSRNVSAEIFVICRGFKAPKRIDPKFLDPRHVFAELAEPTPNNEAKVFNPEKKKRKREGYDENDYLQHKVVPVTDFIHTTDPIAVLGSVHQLSLEQGANGDLALATLNRLSETTDEIRACCADLRVLGRKEFRSLLKWRLKIRDKFGLSTKKAQQEPAVGDEVAQVESMDEELKLQQDMQRFREQEDSKRKKQRRKENERKQKELVRLQLHMTMPQDIGMEQAGPNGEDAMFNLNAVKKVSTATRGDTERMEMVDEGSSTPGELTESSDPDDEDDDGDRLEGELDVLYDTYQQRKTERDSKEQAKRARKRDETDEFQGFDNEDSAHDSDHDVTETDQELPLRPVASGDGLSTRAAMFFDQDLFQDLGISDTLHDESKDSAIDVHDSDDPSVDETRKTVRTNSRRSSVTNDKVIKSDGAKLDAVHNTSNLSKQPAKANEKSMVVNSFSSVSPTGQYEESAPDDEDLHEKNGRPNIDIITAEAMSLAHSLATGSKTTTDLTDDGFNKYSFRDVDGLPEWFLDDESRHSKPQRPISASAAAAIREKMRALNARPIKKVREAQGRKKLRAARRLEKLRKKSALLMDEEGVSERDKADSITKLMARAAKSKKKPKAKVKIVVARGGNRGISGRPKGVKGKYKIVDKRLKKDVKAEKRIAKRKQK